MNPTAFLVLESGQVFPGCWLGGSDRAGEVVFNTSHSGYEEIATDPSYYSQIMVMTAPMQGNYGESDEFWESDHIWIQGFICLEMQKSQRDRSWLSKLSEHGVPVMSEVDTRKLVLYLRENGTTWGAAVQADSEDEARKKAEGLIREGKKQDLDWVHKVTCHEPYDIAGDKADGPRVAVMDFGCKKNSLRELKARCSAVRVFPSRVNVEDLKEWNPDGILLSNGPGNPEDVEQAADTVRELLGWRFIFGICMGHQILARALGAKTYRLKFGHRGSNHPIQDRLLDKIYMTSQNHGYVVDEQSLPSGVQVTHTNLNDNTVSGIHWPEKKCLSVQFHPESHPGPHDAQNLFDFFMQQLR